MAKMSAASRRWQLDHRADLNARRRAKRAAAAALVPHEYKPARTVRPRTVRAEPTGVIYRPPLTDAQRAQKAIDQRARRAHNPPVQTDRQEVAARRYYANALEHEQRIRSMVVKAVEAGSLEYTSPYYDLTVEEVEAIPLVPRDREGRALPIPAA